MTLKYETWCWYNQSLLHRRHGENHRLDGPANIWHDDTYAVLQWYQYGKIHDGNNNVIKIYDSKI